MDAFTRDDLRSLIAHENGPHLSIFLTTHRFGPEAERDALRLKAQLRAARERLGRYGLEASFLEELLAPGFELVENPLLWHKAEEGLALFLAPGFCRFFRVPMPLAERLELGERFAVRPLLPLLAGNGKFYVLAVSLNEVRLLAADATAVTRIELPGLATSMDEALGYTSFNNDLQMHSASPALGRRRGIIHGHGAGDEDRFKTDVLTYFQRLAAELKPFLRDAQARIVLACVDEHRPLFRRAAADPRLLEEGIAGNPELLSDEELRRRAWPIVEPWLSSDLTEELSRHRELIGTPRTAGDLAEVMPAATEGRVGVLFLAREAERWGRMDPATGRVDVHEEQEPGDEDLLETAALYTLARGGKVFALPGERMPQGRVIAANLRY